MRAFDNRSLNVCVPRKLIVVVFAWASCASTPGLSAPAPRDWYREGAGRTVVMLGGGVLGAAMFAPHARELASDFDVIRVQTLNVQVAANGGPMPQDYSVAGEVNALGRTLSAIGVDSPVDIVGSSYGAVVALHFAVTSPERVGTVTLFEPPAFWVLQDADYEDDPVLREMRELTTAMTASASPSDDHLFRFRCLLGACPRIPGRADPERGEWEVSRAAMRGLAAIPAHREDLRRLGQLRHPVLLLTGSETVAFHRRINALLARAIPRVEAAEIPGGHSAPLTSSAAFTEELRSFLARHE